jgi:hypothetical protein
MGGSKTAILAQVVHFYSDGVDHITIGGDSYMPNRDDVPSAIRLLDLKIRDVEPTLISRLALVRLG